MRNFLGTLEKPRATDTCSLALSGKILSYALNVSNKIDPSSWIIDLGATDHMTYNSQKFISYTLNPSNKKIIIVNGTSTTTVGQGDIHVNQYLTIKNVLHVTKLNANLVLI